MHLCGKLVNYSIEGTHTLHFQNLREGLYWFAKGDGAQNCRDREGTPSEGMFVRELSYMYTWHAVPRSTSDISISGGRSYSDWKVLYLVRIYLFSSVWGRDKAAIPRPAAPAAVKGRRGLFPDPKFQGIRVWTSDRTEFWEIRSR